MAGRTFTATATLEVDADLSVSGAWASSGESSGPTWRGRVSGQTTAAGALGCSSIDHAALCISTAGITVVGIVEGALGRDRGSGAWHFSAADSEYRGTGTWLAERRDDEQLSNEGREPRARRPKRAGPPSGGAAVILR